MMLPSALLGYPLDGMREVFFQMLSGAFMTPHQARAVVGPFICWAERASRTNAEQAATIAVLEARIRVLEGPPGPVPVFGWSSVEAMADAHDIPVPGDPPNVYEAARAAYRAWTDFVGERGRHYMALETLEPKEKHLWRTIARAVLGVPEDALPRPTWNHSRGDSPLTPCHECAERMSRTQILDSLREAQQTATRAQAEIEKRNREVIPRRLDVILAVDMTPISDEALAWVADFHDENPQRGLLDAVQRRLAREEHYRRALAKVPVAQCRGELARCVPPPPQADLRGRTVRFTRVVVNETGDRRYRGDEAIVKWQFPEPPRPAQEVLVEWASDLAAIAPTLTRKARVPVEAVELVGPSDVR